MSKVVLYPLYVVLMATICCGGCCVSKITVVPQTNEKTLKSEVVVSVYLEKE